MAKARSVKELIKAGKENMKLNILVFGPQVKTKAPDTKTRDLQEKRKQIKAELENLGHSVKYAEELVDPSLPGIQSNEFLQEIVIMAEYDLIVNIVDSPGSIAEAALVSTKPDLARKTSLFLDSAYAHGLVAQMCKAAKILGADFLLYKYPDDLTECNLLSIIIKKVNDAQFIKLVS